jgi:transposase-like protein
MMRSMGKPRRKFSLEFKLKAVKLSQLKGVEVQAVAEALEIHPFKLSRWRKEARDGVLRGRVSLAPGLFMVGYYLTDACSPQVVK